MTHAIIPHVASADDPAPLPTGWAAARARLDGLPGGGLNIAHEAVDRHVAAGHGAQPALIWLGRGGEREVLTYADLATAAARFAHVLRAHGIAPGERLSLLAGRVPALYAATLGALKAGVVVSPLFAAFGPGPVRARMEIGVAAALVTTEAQYRRKIADWRAGMPALRLVLIMGDSAPEGCVALGPAMAAAPPPSRRPRPAPRTWRCCISPPARPACPRASSMSTRPSSPMPRRGASRSTCARATSTGAPPTPAG